MQDPARRLDVGGLRNGRDLGGLRRRDGTRTPRGVFFRSESTDALTEAGWAALHGAGIRTVLDLRQPRERALDTGGRPAWLTTLAVDLDGLEDTEFWVDHRDDGLLGTALYFAPHLAALPHRSGAALRALITAGPGGVLFHCAGGRDRTGLIALLLLIAADVEPDDIVDDHLETVRTAPGRGLTQDEADRERVCAEHGTTTEGAFRGALYAVDLVGLLDAAGFSRAERERLTSWRGALEGGAAGSAVV